jgi:hypothetical protein
VVMHSHSGNLGFHIVIQEAPVDTFGRACHRGIQAQASPEAFLRWIRKEGEICISLA